MIVADKVESIRKANEISSQLLILISKECAEFKFSFDDPAENIYLISHIVGTLVAKVCISLEEYAKIYGITGANALTKEAVINWLNAIAKENME